MKAFVIVVLVAIVVALFSALVFLYRDRGLTRSFAERAQAAGYRALVLTTDNQVLGQRERDLRNGFTIPPRFTWRGGLGMVRSMPWLVRMARRGTVTLANYVSDERKDILSLAKHINDLLDPALCWTGCKATGRGGALSEIGYHNLTRPRSYHLRKRRQ